MTLTDFHTHRHDAAGAIISMSPAMAESFILKNPEAKISVGIHPWDTVDTASLELLDNVAAMSQVVAIGETGLDKLRGASVAVQADILRRHVELSERQHKPLIIHCVKAWDMLLGIRREMNPSQPWGIHGFRGGPQQASQLLAHGFYLSLGEHFNPATAAIIPDDRLLVETDESGLGIDIIIDRISACRVSRPPVADTLSCFLHLNRCQYCGDDK